MVRRHTILALSALIGGAGCHAGSSGRVAKSDPPALRSAVSVERFVEQHNRNATAVRTLTASPSIHATADGHTYRVNGQMAMERPRSFKLELKAGLSKVADIGSNGQGFWFWVKDNKDKAIYVCDYKDVKTSPLAVTLQPEWIVEAMGLREISPDEIATIAAKPGDKPGLLVLTQGRRDARGELLTKETIVEESNGHIIEHRLYSGAKRDLLARASISQYFAKKLEPTADDPSGTTIELPQRFVLEWITEQFTLDVQMGSPQINQAFTVAQREGRFTEPTIAGANRVNLAMTGGPTSNSSRVYESMPSPRSGVRLGQPEPVPAGVEGAMGPSRVAPRHLAADLGPARTDVIGARVPRAADPDAVRAGGFGSRWRKSSLEQ